MMDPKAMEMLQSKGKKATGALGEAKDEEIVQEY